MIIALSVLSKPISVRNRRQYKSKQPLPLHWIQLPYRFATVKVEEFSKVTQTLVGLTLVNCGQKKDIEICLEFESGSSCQLSHWSFGIGAEEIDSIHPIQFSGWISLVWLYSNCSLVLRPLRIFILQPWRKIGSLWFSDKIWEWPGDEANFTQESVACELRLGILAHTIQGMNSVGVCNLSPIVIH